MGDNWQCSMAPSENFTRVPITGLFCQDQNYNTFYRDSETIFFRWYLDLFWKGQYYFLLVKDRRKTIHD